MTQIRQWWQGLAPRERLLLAVLAIVASCSLYVFGIVQPLYVAASQAKRDYVRALDQADALLAKVERIEAAGPLNGRQVRSTLQDITASATANGLSVKSAITGSGGVSQLSFENVEATALLKWLMGVRGSLSMAVYEVQIQRGAPGLVSASVSLKQRR